MSVTKYVSKSELLRAARAEYAAFEHYCQPVPSLGGDEAFIEELIHRGHEYLKRHPTSRKAAARVAELEAERDRRAARWQTAWDRLLELAHRFEELQGDPCPQVRAAQENVALRRPCWLVKKIVGQSCALREAMEAVRQENEVHKE